MDQKTVDKLEREIEKAIAGVVARLGLKRLPLLPSQKTMRMMAKAAVAVYEGAVDEPRPADGEPWPLLAQQPYLLSFHKQSDVT